MVGVSLVVLRTTLPPPFCEHIPPPLRFLCFSLLSFSLSLCFCPVLRSLLFFLVLQRELQQLLQLRLVLLLLLELGWQLQLLLLLFCGCFCCWCASGPLACCFLGASASVWLVLLLRVWVLLRLLCFRAACLLLALRLRQRLVGALASFVGAATAGVLQGRLPAVRFGCCCYGVSS